MNKINELSQSEIEYVIQNGEFSAELLATGCAAFVLTQDWCPQWTSMARWLPSVEEKIKVYAFEYNNSPLYEQFMNLKEKQWKNDLIPYVRYYKDGILIAESNYLEKAGFSAIFNG